MPTGDTAFDIRNPDELLDMHRQSSRNTTVADGIDCLVQNNDLALENEALNQASEQRRRANGSRQETTSRRNNDEYYHRSNRHSPSSNRKRPSSPSTTTRHLSATSRSHHHHYPIQRQHRSPSASPPRHHRSSRPGMSGKRPLSHSRSPHERRPPSRRSRQLSPKERTVDDELLAISISEEQQKSSSSKSNNLPLDNVTPVRETTGTDLSLISEDESNRTTKINNEQSSITANTKPSVALTPSQSTNSMLESSTIAQDCENAALTTTTTNNTLRTPLFPGNDLTQTLDLINKYKLMQTQPSNDAHVNAWNKEIHILIQRQIELQRKELDHREREMLLRERELIEREKRLNERSIDTIPVEQSIVPIQPSSLPIEEKLLPPPSATTIEPISNEDTITKSIPSSSSIVEGSKTKNDLKQIAKHRSLTTRIDPTIFSSSSTTLDLYSNDEDEEEQNLSSLNKKHEIVLTTIEPPSTIEIDPKVISPGFCRKVEFQSGEKSTNLKSSTHDLRLTLTKYRHYDESSNGNDSNSQDNNNNNEDETNKSKQHSKDDKQQQQRSRDYLPQRSVTSTPVDVFNEKRDYHHQRTTAASTGRHQQPQFPGQSMFPTTIPPSERPYSHASVPQQPRYGSNHRRHESGDLRSHLFEQNKHPKSSHIMSISDEEFQRFQNQLVELKTKNYQLEEQNKRAATENAQLKAQIETTDKDSINLRFPTKLPWKIRRISGRDVDDVQRENEVLARKVQTQEEEFKLQNETIMRELNGYATKAEQLENELQLYKEGRHSSITMENTDNLNVLIEENRRLQAENNVLQKKLAELSNTAVESISMASSSNESFQKEDGDVECDDNRRSDASLVHVVSPKSAATGFNGEMKTFDTLSLRLETEQEEKRLVHEQLRKLEFSSNEIHVRLSKQIDFLKEKLDEKQNTCLQLQRDFEKRIQDMITESNNTKTTNELQIDVLKSDNKRLQEEIQTITKTKDDEIAKYQKRLNDLQMNIDHLESQIGTVSAEQNHHLRAANAEHQRILEDKELLLNQILVDRDLLRTEIEQSKEAYETLLQTVQILEEQITTKTREFESQQRLADQRKVIIDEIAANSLQAEEKAKQLLHQQRDKFQADIERYEREIAELKIKDRTLKQLQARCAELEIRVKSDDEVKQVLTRRLEEFQNEILELKQNFVQQFDEQKRHYEKCLADEQHNHQEHIQNLTEILSTKAHTIEELNAQIDVFKQESLTYVDEKRAHERKGAALMKDLQKQLHGEKKKNERMQEKLTELLSGDKAALDELFYLPKNDGSRQGDTGSVSSFGGTASLASAVPINAIALEQENNDLIMKLARSQEERAILEEKVRHLETSSSAMANDLIQRYSSDKRGSAAALHSRLTTPPSRRRQHSSIDRQGAGPTLNLRNMFDSFSNNARNPSTNDDAIKNLQRLLEETLTKNMHLQKNLEDLSLQLQKQSLSPAV